MAWAGRVPAFRHRCPAGPHGVVPPSRRPFDEHGGDDIGQARRHDPGRSVVARQQEPQHPFAGPFCIFPGQLQPEQLAGMPDE
jgi:hypothetical protein